MQVAHFPRVAAVEPLIQMSKFGKLRGGSDAAKIKSLCACKFNCARRRVAMTHGSILVGRASACLLLNFVAVVEVKSRQAEARPTRDSCTMISRKVIQDVERIAIERVMMKKRNLGKTGLEISPL